MYKIYINETPLILTNKPLAELLAEKDASKLAGQYDGKVKTLFRFIDQCEKSDRFKEIWVCYNDVEKLFQDFNSLYKRIDAAGGIVESEHEKILLIFRRGMWDLPKGKIEKNESIEDAAVREVEEETGITVYDSIDRLIDTFHTYKLKDKRILKKTYWFLMKYKSGNLVPQTEEKIDQLIWIAPHDALKKTEIYENIKAVLFAYQNRKNQ